MNRMNISALNRPSLLVLFIFLLYAVSSTSCMTSKLEHGSAEHTTASERIARGKDLENRLLRIRDVKPVFSSQRQLTAMELEEFTRFAKTLPSGTFIVGGVPAFWLNLDQREEKGIKDSKRILYRVTLTRADNGATIRQSEQWGVCIESEAMITYPTRCSLLRPLLIRRALEKL